MEFRHDLLGRGVHVGFPDHLTQPCVGVFEAERDKDRDVPGAVIQHLALKIGDVVEELLGGNKGRNGFV